MVILSEESELSTTSLLGKQHCVELTDARSILISILYYDIGLNMIQISSLTGFSVSGVSYLLNRVNDRFKQNLSYKVLYNKVKNRVSNEIIANA